MVIALHRSAPARFGDQPLLPAGCAKAMVNRDFVRELGGPQSCVMRGLGHGYGAGNRLAPVSQSSWLPQRALCQSWMWLEAAIAVRIESAG